MVKSRVETTKILANAITSCKTPPKVFATVSGVGRYTVIERGQYTAWLGKEIFNIDSQQFSPISRKWTFNSDFKSLKIKKTTKLWIEQLNKYLCNVLLEKWILFCFF